MAYVPGFSFDLFVSYSREDNAEGHITALISDLEAFLARDLGTKFVHKPEEWHDFPNRGRIFLDQTELDGQTAIEWESVMMAAAKSSALLVPLVSPQYAKSKYCASEFSWFSSAQPLEWLPANAGAAPSDPAKCSVFRLAPVLWWKLASDLERELPPELLRAQHMSNMVEADGYPLGPGTEAWRKGVRALGEKLANALRKMRRCQQSVYVGWADPAAASVRESVIAEVSGMGFRVVPETHQVYWNADLTKQSLAEAQMAIHFLGGQTTTTAIEAIRHSLECCLKGVTVVYEVPAVSLSYEEKVLITWIEEDRAQTGLYDRVNRKSEGEFLFSLRERLGAAATKRATNVGIAFEDGDRASARSVADRIHERTGFTVSCHGLQLLDFKKSKGLLYYWGDGEGTKLRQTRPVTKQSLAAWYLAPPPNDHKTVTDSLGPMVFRQQGQVFEVEDIRAFLELLGWK